jgi:hypothetical protein
MGKLARITELERTILILKAQLQVERKRAEFLNYLLALPEDAVLLYREHGMEIRCEAGKAIRVALSDQSGADVHDRFADNI